MEVSLPGETQGGATLKGLWVPVSGALAREKQIEAIANNVANATTPGFKKDRFAFREYLTVLDKGYRDIDLPDREWSPVDFYKSYGAENAMVRLDGSFTDFEQGQLVPTGNPLDIALKGQGFFEVLSPRGVRATRRGTFTLSPGGFLVNGQGDFVLTQRPGGAGGEVDNMESRKIRLEGAKDITVNLRGDLFKDGQRAHTLSIVSFKDPHALKKEGNSYFINQDRANLISSDGETAVHQGFLEQSNVNPMGEMSRLIKANRQFESIQRAIKAYDHMAERVANDVASF